MRGKSAQIVWRAGDDAASLKAQYLCERDLQIRPRLHLLWLVRTGEQIKSKRLPPW